MTKTAILAYLAGAIDSDGCISIHRTREDILRRDGGVHLYREVLALKQVTPEIPYLLKEVFGGTTRLEKPGSLGSQHLYTWIVGDRRAIECVRALLPFLRIKRAQALNCLELRKIKERSKRLRLRQKGKGARVRPAHISEAMDAAYLKAKSLNGGIWRTPHQSPLLACNHIPT